MKGEQIGRSSGARPRPASAPEGCWLCGKGSSSPDPESGEQWTPFGKINLLPGGKRIQGTRKPSAVLSADVCLYVCLPSALRVCVCRHCLWSSSFWNLWRHLKFFVTIEGFLRDCILVFKGVSDGDCQDYMCVLTLFCVVSCDGHFALSGHQLDLPPFC